MSCAACGAETMVRQKAMEEYGVLQCRCCRKFDGTVIVRGYLAVEAEGIVSEDVEMSASSGEAGEVLKVDVEMSG
jgi:hypothetical protein